MLSGQKRKRNLETVPDSQKTTLNSLKQACEEFGRQDLYVPLSRVLDLNIKWLDKNLELFLKKGRYEIAANVMLFESKMDRAREYFEKARRSTKVGSERHRCLAAVLANLDIVSKIARRSWRLSGKYVREDVKGAVAGGKISALDRAVFAKILVAIDGSKYAAGAIRVAIKMAKREVAELIVVSVVQRPSYVFSPVSTGRIPPMAIGEYYDYARKNAGRWVNETVPLAKGWNVAVKGHVLKASSSVVKSITDYAKIEEVDLIVLGTRGLGGFDRLLLGSVSSGVVTHASCAVLVVR
jgi:nucleotide-binding universal stress UspA family protein